MRGTLFIGLDVGTTTSKAVVFTEDAEPVASGRANTPWTITTSGAELDARALLAAAKSAVAEALSECPPGPIGGLGVASLAESGVDCQRAVVAPRPGPARPQCAPPPAPCLRSRMRPS